MVCGSTVKDMDKERIIIKMVQFLREIWFKEKKKGQESLSFLIKQEFKHIGQRIKYQGTEKYSIQTVITTKAGLAIA